MDPMEWMNIILLKDSDVVIFYVIVGLLERN